MTGGAVARGVQTPGDAARRLERRVAAMQRNSRIAQVRRRARRARADIPQERHQEASGADASGGGRGRCAARGDDDGVPRQADIGERLDGGCGRPRAQDREADGGGGRMTSEGLCLFIRVFLKRKRFASAGVRPPRFIRRPRNLAHGVLRPDRRIVQAPSNTSTDGYPRGRASTCPAA